MPPGLKGDGPIGRRIRHGVHASRLPSRTSYSARFGNTTGTPQPGRPCAPGRRAPAHRAARPLVSAKPARCSPASTGVRSRDACASRRALHPAPHARPLHRSRDARRRYTSASGAGRSQDLRTLRIEARRCRLRKGDERRMQRIAGRGCNGRWKPRSSSTEPHGCPQAAARHGAALPGRLPRSSPHTRLEQRQQRSGRGRTAGRTRRRHPDPAAFGPRRPPSAGTWPRPPRCADAEASRHGIGRRQALAGCELAALMRRRHRLRQRSRVDQPG
jgi:hypothetical protein